MGFRDHADMLPTQPFSPREMPLPSSLVALRKDVLSASLGKKYRNATPRGLQCVVFTRRFNGSHVAVDIVVLCYTVAVDCVKVQEARESAPRGHCRFRTPSCFPVICSSATAPNLVPC